MATPTPAPTAQTSAAPATAATTAPQPQVNTAEQLGLSTYGDLKKLINYIKIGKKGGNLLIQGKDFAVDQLLGLIPGASNAKSAFTFAKTLFTKPDSVKTNTWLDRLDIDDNMSKIVDDTVENGFLQAIAKTLESTSDNTPLEQDFNMNKKMAEYLKKQYGGRFVSGTGVTENKQLYEIRKVIRQIITEELNKKGA